MDKFNDFPFHVSKMVFGNNRTNTNVNEHISFRVRNEDEKNVTVDDILGNAFGMDIPAPRPFFMHNIAEEKEKKKKNPPRPVLLISAFYFDDIFKKFVDIPILKHSLMALKSNQIDEKIIKSEKDYNEIQSLFQQRVVELDEKVSSGFKKFKQKVVKEMENKKNEFLTVIEAYRKRKIQLDKFTKSENAISKGTKLITIKFTTQTVWSSLVLNCMDSFEVIFSYLTFEQLLRNVMLVNWSFYYFVLNRTKISLFLDTNLIVDNLDKQLFSDMIFRFRVERIYYVEEELLFNPIKRDRDSGARRDAVKKFLNTLVTKNKSYLKVVCYYVNDKTSWRIDKGMNMTIRRMEKLQKNITGHNGIMQRGYRNDILHRKDEDFVKVFEGILKKNSVRALSQLGTIRIDDVEGNLKLDGVRRLEIIFFPFNRINELRNLSFLSINFYATFAYPMLQVTPSGNEAFSRMKTFCDFLEYSAVNLKNLILKMDEINQQEKYHLLYFPSVWRSRDRNGRRRVRGYLGVDDDDEYENVLNEVEEELHDDDDDEDDIDDLVEERLNMGLLPNLNNPIMSGGFGFGFGGRRAFNARVSEDKKRKKTFEMGGYKKNVKAMIVKMFLVVFDRKRMKNLRNLSVGIPFCVDENATTLYKSELIEMGEEVQRMQKVKKFVHFMADGICDLRIIRMNFRDNGFSNKYEMFMQELFYIVSEIYKGSVEPKALGKMILDESVCMEFEVFKSIISMKNLKLIIYNAGCKSFGVNPLFLKLSSMMIKDCNLQQLTHRLNTFKTYTRVDYENGFSDSSLSIYAKTITSELFFSFFLEKTNLKKLEIGNLDISEKGNFFVGGVEFFHGLFESIGKSNFIEDFSMQLYVKEDVGGKLIISHDVIDSMTKVINLNKPNLKSIHIARNGESTSQNESKFSKFRRKYIKKNKESKESVLEDEKKFQNSVKLLLNALTKNEFIQHFHFLHLFYKEISQILQHNTKRSQPSQKKPKKN